jgi:arylsulfatase A-like enzyme
MRLGLIFFLVTASLPFSLWADDDAAFAGSRPNILLIITDDQGYPPVGIHGHPWLKTPHLDALAHQSTRFDRFLVSPTCAPTRSALMTGRHPMRNGITHTILERERLALNAVTLPQVLSKVGYKSGIFGKWHLGDEDAYQPQARGFDEAFIHGGGGIGQSYDCSCADAPGNRYFDPFVRHNGKFVKTKGFCTDVFFDAAIDWIKNQSQHSQPFFAYVATNAPHAPYVAPVANKQRFLEMGFNKDQAGFYGMIENIDENVGRLVQTLEGLNLLENTVVIFMSDNGMAGMPGKPKQPIGRDANGADLFVFNGDMKGFKGSVDEGGVRVPFFMRWDKKIPADAVRNEVATHLDVFPTLAALAGAELPTDQVEGRSLLPLLAQDSSLANAAIWPDRLLFDHTGRWPTGSEPNNHQWRNFTVRNHRFRLVDGTQLFDMQTDPGQTTNCVDKYPDLVRSMREAYDEWWKQTRPMMVNESAPMSQTRPFHEAFYAQDRAEGIPLWKPNKANTP